MGRARWILASVVLGAATVACESGSPPPTRSATPPRVSRIEATGGVPGAGMIGLMDDLLVGLGSEPSLGPVTVAVSRDDGRTWSTADLPDRPADLDLARPPYGLYVSDEVTAVAGRDAASASPVFPIAKSQFIVWTTTDGDDWTAHPLDTAGGIVGGPSVMAVGPLLVASSSSVDGFNLFTSSDRGASWRRAQVDGLGPPGEYVDLLEVSTGDRLWMVVGGPSDAPETRRILTSDDEGAAWTAGPCDLDCPEAERLLHREDQTSIDGGATWRQIEIDPPPAIDGWTSFSSIVEVEGGWLASAESYTGEDSYGMLLRSDDGRAWRQMLPADRCERDRDEPDRNVSDPIRSADRWYVTVRCVDEGVVFTAAADGREFEPIDATERDGVSFGDPMVDGDRLLIPEFEDFMLVGVTTIG